MIWFQVKPGEVLFLENVRYQTVLLPTVRAQARIVLVVSIRAFGGSKFPGQCAEVDGCTSRHQVLVCCGEVVRVLIYIYVLIIIAHSLLLLAEG